MTKNLLKLLLVAVVLTLGTNAWALPVPDEDGGADGGWNYNITITCGDEPEPFASGIAPENSTVWVNFSRYCIYFSGGDAGSSTVVPKAIDYILITKASEETDAVRTVAAQQQPTAVFNLAGQQMRRAQKGINIVGGKKLLVK